ncbi:MAG: N-acyl-D-aspartate/D-glutamate deacylase, partial [Planctomycetota bacterium]
IEAGAAGSAEERTCFTCHSQALPIFALTEAKRRGFTINETNLQRQLDHTLAHLERGKAGYLEGKGQGGQSVTAGYAMWALEVGGHAADETTAAVASYLLQDQKDLGHWRHPGNRPPSSGSAFTTTSIALRAIKAYGTAEQQPEIDSRIATVRQWLVETKPRDTEDRVFRLHALRTVEAGDELIEQAVANLLAGQRDDGGWAQTDEMKSDAYATGSSIVALFQSGKVTNEDERLQRGLKFLLDAQFEDGSWHVTTRAKPIQAYFESGFPHGADQFISIAASSWATLALVLASRASHD